MFLRILFYSILFYFVVRIIRVVGRLVSGVSSGKPVDKQNKNRGSKVYSKEEIEEAEYEEIK